MSIYCVWVNEAHYLTKHLSFTESSPLAIRRSRWPVLYIIIVTGFAKRVFHMHPIWWPWKTVTSIHYQNYIWNWNVFQPLSYVGAFCWPNLKLIAFTDLKLRLVKVDVRERPILQIQPLRANLLFHQSPHYSHNYYIHHHMSTGLGHCIATCVKHVNIPKYDHKLKCIAITPCTIHQSYYKHSS